MCFLHGAPPGSRHFFPSNSMVSQQILLRLIASLSCTSEPLLRVLIFQGESHCCLAQRTVHLNSLTVVVCTLNNVDYVFST